MSEQAPMSADPNAIVAPGSAPSPAPAEQKPNEQQPATLEFLNKTLGRNFSSLDEATKSLTNLNSMVGDQAVAKAREDAVNFDKVVRSYAKAENLTPEKAREELLAEVTKSGNDNSPAPSTQPNSGDSAYNELKMRFDEKEFLEANPEAKDLLPNLRILVKAGGQSYQSTYETSGLKAVMTDAKTAREAAAAKANTAAPSNQRTAPVLQDAELISKIKSGRGSDIDKANLVGRLIYKKQ